MSANSVLSRETSLPKYETLDPLRALRLAGTVSIPSPYPEPGRITAGRLPLPGGQSEPAPDMLRIEHRQSNLLQVVRTVRCADVQAVFLADHPDNPPELRNRWLLGEDDLSRMLASAGLHHGQSQRKAPPAMERGRDDMALIGTVFVKEQSSLLMEVQIGMTAAESVEYYPPVAQARSDRHSNPVLMACHGPTPCH
jgi:hypothetical protein